MPEQSLLAKFGPDLRVAVWAGDESLSTQVPYFTTFDYLLDGLPLSQIRLGGDSAELTFIHTIFGKQCWVFYFDANRVSWSSLRSRLENVPPELRTKLLMVNTALIPSDIVKGLNEFFGFVEHT